MRKLILLSMMLFALCGCFNTPKAPEHTLSPSPPPTFSSDVGGISVLSDKIICIDAGHGKSQISYQEPVAPGSDIKKPAFVSGASGKLITEADFNLLLSQELCSALTNLGVKVVMTRTNIVCNLSNIGRAEVANQNEADLMIRIHADGSDDSTVSGISMLVPTADYIPQNLADVCSQIGDCMLKNIIFSTGSKSRGLSLRADMTGFNWSRVPVVLLEAGFISNPEEEALLADEEYRQKIITGIIKGLESYYTNSEE